jgi:hypothetical protein
VLAPAIVASAKPREMPLNSSGPSRMACRQCPPLAAHPHSCFSSRPLIIEMLLRSMRAIGASDLMPGIGITLGCGRLR